MESILGKRTVVVIGVLALILLAVFNISQWFLYMQMKQLLEESIQTRLMETAELTADGIDPFLVPELIDGSYSLSDYADLVSLLEERRRLNRLTKLRLLDPNGADTLDKGSALESLNLTEFSLAVSGIAASTEVLRSDSLYLAGAYAPVNDFDGNAVAVVHAEAGYEVFAAIGSMRQYTILINLGSVAFVLLFALVLYFVNRKLIVANQALLRASAISSMGEMAATIAHEIRNPLGIIRNSAERIKKKYGDSSDPVFDYIPGEVDRLNSIVSGYLDFANPVKREKETFDIVPLIEEILDKMRSDLDKANVGIDFKQDGKRNDIEGDKFALRQAILNLIINGRDAQPDGGQISVSVTGASQQNGRIVTDIADRGPGVPLAERIKIFEPFYTSRQKGSGLGLHVARNVIESHGGTIEVLDGESGGALFRISLPGKG